MIEIRDIGSPEELGDLKQGYLESLSAPLDGMWEVFAGMGRQLEILSAGERAGYFSINEEGQVLQFHLAPEFQPAAAQLFAAAVARDEVQGAIVSTADPLLLGLCLDLQQSLRVHTYLYQDHRRVDIELTDGAGASLDLVQESELDEIAALQRESLDGDLGDWLVVYLTNLIARRELHALRLNGEVLGTGETRVSDSQPPHVDLGVITMRRHRRRGVASYILGRLKQHCYERNLVPICSAAAGNVASLRAIARAGFVSRHRLLEVTF